MESKKTIGNPWESHAFFARVWRYVRRAARRRGLRARGFRWGRRVRSPASTNRAWRDPEPRTALADWVSRYKEGPGLWKWTHYLDAYERHLAKFVGGDVHVVEIGVYSGGSLTMWREYFGPRSHIHGIDIAEECRAYESDRVSITIGDQADPEFWDQFVKQLPSIDVVIDDGGHQVDQQVATLEALLPRLTPGGVYICEDVAGVNNPFHDYLAGLSRNLDVWNAPDPRESRTIPTQFQTMVASIHRYPYMVVIERSADPPTEFVSPRIGTDWVPF